MATTTYDDQINKPAETSNFTTAAAPAAATGVGLLTSTTAPAATPRDYTADLQGLYKDTLGREGDKGGLDFYNQQLQKGATTLEGVRADMGKSLEAQKQQVFANLTPVKNAEAAKASTYSYDPTKQETRAESLVQNQLAAITSTGSKLNEAAEARAAQAANRRGLLNSSMAVEAGQKAVLDASLPVAQQDAGTFASADTANAQYANTAAQFNTAAKNTAGLQDAQLQTQVNIENMRKDLQQRLAEIQASTTLSTADKQAATQKAISDSDNAAKMELQKMDGIIKTSLQNLDAASKEKLSQVEADNRQLLQTNISAANAYAQYAQALSSISTSDKMDAAAKQQAADNQLQSLQATLRAIGQVSGLDLSKYFQQATITGPVTPEPDRSGGKGLLETPTATF
jgi:hypothetical protein